MGFRKFLNESLAVIVMVYGLAGVLATIGACIAITNALEDPAFVEELVELDNPDETVPAGPAGFRPEAAVTDALEGRLTGLASGLKLVATVALWFIGAIHAMFFLIGLSLVLHKQRLDAPRAKK